MHRCSVTCKFTISVDFSRLRPWLLKELLLVVLLLKSLVLMMVVELVETSPGREQFLCGLLNMELLLLLLLVVLVVLVVLE